MESILNLQDTAALWSNVTYLAGVAVNKADQTTNNFSALGAQVTTQDLSKGLVYVLQGF